LGLTHYTGYVPTIQMVYLVVITAIGGRILVDVGVLQGVILLNGDKTQGGIIPLEDRGMVVLRGPNLLITVGSTSSVNKGLVINTRITIPLTGATLAGVRAFQKGW